MPPEPPPAQPQEARTQGRRRLDVELLRIISIAMVVAIHSMAPTIVLAQKTGQTGFAYWLALVANEVSRPGVPVFFAIMGWVLLRRPTAGDPVWLRDRFLRLAVPLLVWSIIEAADAVVMANLTGVALWPKGKPGVWLGDQLVRILAGPGTRTSLWFMYYALAMTVAIWLVAAARPAVAGFRTAYAAIGAGLVLAFGLAAAFKVSLSWETFGWTLGYAALGVVLIETPAKRRWAGALAFGVGAGLTVAGIAWRGYDTWPSLYFSPAVLLATVGVLVAVAGTAVPERWAALVTKLGALTFGVYFVHPLFLDVMRLASRNGGPLDAVPLAARLVLTWVVAIVGAFGAAALWHRSERLARILG